MAKKPKRSLVSFLETIPDPRVDRTKKHALTDIFALTLAATLNGAESFEAVHSFGVEQEDWLRTFLPLKNGIPSADTCPFPHSDRIFGVILTELPSEPASGFTSGIRQTRRSDSAACSRWAIRLFPSEPIYRTPLFPRAFGRRYARRRSGGRS